MPRDRNEPNLPPAFRLPPTEQSVMAKAVNREIHMKVDMTFLGCPRLPSFEQGVFFFFFFWGGGGGLCLSC